MRSFSSLLCHILGSHPEIDGYAETHQSYLGRIDLHRLTRRVGQMIGEQPSGRYVMDKLLDDAQQIAANVLERPEVSVLFLLRNPADTIDSILSMARTHGHEGRFSDPEGVVGYYETRLKQLERYSAQCVGRAMFVEAETLLSSADAALGRLAAWLRLREPLSTQYRMFSLTGVSGYGDYSPNIMCGRLLTDADRERHPAHGIELPAEVVHRGEAAHASCREVLLRRSAL
ncbi:MAG TPA: hypothetical protein VMG37_23915 [Solirubrobacteraceae bacterium]|nr:hypothetical protein [Solirubrobacteraceae bacterium]